MAPCNKSFVTLSGIAATIHLLLNPFRVVHVVRQFEQLVPATERRFAYCQLPSRTQSSFPRWLVTSSSLVVPDRSSQADIVVEFATGVCGTTISQVKATPFLGLLNCLEIWALDPGATSVLACGARVHLHTRPESS